MIRCRLEYKEYGWPFFEIFKEPSIIQIKSYLIMQRLPFLNFLCYRMSAKWDRDKRPISFPRLSSISNLCRIFRLRWPAKCLGGPIFLGEELNFTNRQSHNISGNFFKICIKANKNLKRFWENLRKKRIFRKGFNDLAGQLIFNMEKMRNIIWTGYNWGVIGPRRPKLEN